MTPKVAGGSVEAANRRGRRAMTGTHVGGMALPPAAPRRVEKTYSTRLPVSGEEPPKLTAYERRRAAARRDR